MCVPFRPGKYFLSVVAFNYGFLHSAAACSDGILYDNSPPFIGNISFTNVTFFPGLVREMIGQDYQLWLIDSAGMRRRIEHNTDNTTCIASATDIDNIGIYPESGDSIISLSTACDLYTPFKRTAYQRIARQIIVGWSGFDFESGILNYEIGLTTIPNIITPPNLLSFTNLTLLTSYTSYPDVLTHTTTYFVILRATNHALQYSTIISDPVSIDTTGPLINGDITAVVNTTHTTVSWADNTFVDAEFPSEPLIYEIAVGQFSYIHIQG